MKKNKRILLPVLIVLFSSTIILCQSYDDFYYAFDQKVYINIVSNKYVDEFPNGVDENMFTQNNLEIEKLNSELSDVYEISSVTFKLGLQISLLKFKFFIFAGLPPFLLDD